MWDWIITAVHARDIQDRNEAFNKAMEKRKVASVVFDSTDDDTDNTDDLEPKRSKGKKVAAKKQRDEWTVEEGQRRDRKITEKERGREQTHSLCDELEDTHA